MRGAKDGRLKIATFNVNGITARLPNLLRWIFAFEHIGR